MARQAVDSLPQEVRLFLQRNLARRDKTVDVTPLRVPTITELPPVRANRDTSKPASDSFAVSPYSVVRANHNSLRGQWPHYTEVVAETIPLQPRPGPWSIVDVIRDWGGGISTVIVKHGAADERYAPQKVMLSAFAAALLYTYARTRGSSRKRSLEAMAEYERLARRPVWDVARDQLLSLDLVKPHASGGLRATARGVEVASRIPDSYDPDRWAHPRVHWNESTGEVTEELPQHAPDQLFGTTYDSISERVYHG